MIPRTSEIFIAFSLIFDIDKRATEKKSDSRPEHLDSRLACSAAEEEGMEM